MLTIGEYNFLCLTLRAMSHLKQSKRSNVVHGLVAGLGKMRADQSDSRLPALNLYTNETIGIHCQFL